MTKKQDAEPKAEKKQPFTVSKEDILIASGLLSEICGVAAQCGEQWRESIWSRAAVVAEVLRQLRMNAQWSEEQQGDAAK